MSDGGGGEDNSGTMEVSAVQTVADTSVLQKHIRKLVPLLLEDGGEAPASLETALEEKSSVEQMKKFLADPQVHTILVERSCLKGLSKLSSCFPRREITPAGKDTVFICYHLCERSERVVFQKKKKPDNLALT